MNTSSPNGLSECRCECHGRFDHPCSLPGGCGHLHENAAQKRPDGACVLCQPPQKGKAWELAEEGYKTCRACWKHLAKNVREVADLYAQLDPTPGAAGGNDGPRPPGFASAPAADLHVVAMTDTRSSSEAHVWVGGDGRVHTESERPPLSVFNVLDTLAWDIAEQRDFEDGHKQTTVLGLCEWLDNQLDWVTRQADVTDFSKKIRKLIGQLKPAIGDTRVWVANCPNTIDEGEHTRVCGANLYAPARMDVIRCGACGRQWVNDDWDSDSPDSLKNLLEDRRKRLAS